MRRLTGLIYILLIFGGTFITPVKAQDAQLRVSLTPVATLVQGDGDVLLRVTISNPTSKPITIPVWQVPSDDIPTPILKVTTADGSVVPYTGPLVKWSAEALKTGVTFAPRTSQVFVIELSSLYDIGNGRFRIDYSQDGPGKFDQAGRSSRVFGTIAPAFIETRGRSRGLKGETSNSIGASAYSLSTLRCTTDQKSKITTAVSDATAYTDAANAYLASKDSSTYSDTRYTTWFGLVSSSRWDLVKSHYTSIYSAFTTQGITVDCSCKKTTVYAYVYPSQPYRIYVCGAFWKAPAQGTDSKAGTLIHEMSHFTVVAGTNDYAYGQSAAKSLAISDPAKAVSNADSHEYFAENSPALP